jgi:hypothetical protein
MTEFEKQKGKSYLLTKKISECTPDEKDYKQAYARYIKQRYMARLTPEKIAEKTSSYNKEYYRLNRDQLRNKARVRIADIRGARKKITKGVTML